MQMTKLLTAIALLGMVGACTNAAPPPADPPNGHVVMFAPVDDGSTYLQELHTRWPAAFALEQDGVGVSLLAPTRAELERLVASDPSLPVPDGDRLAYEATADGRVRMVLVQAGGLDVTGEVDSERVVHDADTKRVEVLYDLSDSSARDFAALTARVVGHRLAEIVDGTVIATPVVEAPITGGHVMLTFGAAETDAQAAAFAALLK